MRFAVFFSQRQEGLTLLELLVVVAIIAIIGFFGFPAMDGWQTQRKLASYFEELGGFIRIMKSEAEARSTTVRVTFANIANEWTVSAFYFDIGGGAAPPANDCLAGAWIAYPDNVNPRTVVIPVAQAALIGPNRLCFHRDSSSSGNPNATPYTYIIQSPAGSPNDIRYRLQINQPTSFMTRAKWSTQAGNVYIDM